MRRWLWCAVLAVSVAARAQEKSWSIARSRMAAMSGWR